MSWAISEVFTFSRNPPLKSDSRKEAKMKKEIMVKREIKPRMLSVDEAALYLGLASKTIRNRIGPRAADPFPIKPKRIGGRVLFDVKDLDAYLDSLPAS